MNGKGYTATIIVEQSPEVALEAIQNLALWWSGTEGASAQVGDQCVHRYKDVHRCTLKLIKRVPYRRVVWQVLDNHFSFTKDKAEWTGTSLEFEVLRKDDKTHVRFTHRGLVPAYECFGVRSNAWDSLIKDNLKRLIATGNGIEDSGEA
jgi:hypothetical protein